MPDEEKAAEELSKPGADADLHITFHGVDADDERQRRGPGVGRSTSRASSRSSRRRLPQTSPYAGIPIQYRTLSIHEVCFCFVCLIKIVMYASDGQKRPAS